jgi:pimeloyl-ACP methyl ester carboxylesterase
MYRTGLSRKPLLILGLVSALPVLGITPSAALELEDCRISAGEAFPSLKARCGVLDRPLNPEDPESETIGIRVAVVPALNLEPDPDPLVPIAGGPGQGSVEFYTSYRGAFEAVRRNRDILLVDQRGTGESARMDCEFDDDVVGGQMSKEETKELTQECLDSLPYDPRFFSTSVAVTDLEAVREALGYPALNLYGVSYGTRVAQHFARRYPEHVRTIVLDGVAPPQVALGPEIAIESQRAIDEIFDRCEEDPDCNERFPDLAERFDDLKRDLETDPARVRFAHPLTGEYETLRFGRSELAGAVRLLAYQPTTIALMPLLISEAAKGNLVPLAAQFSMTADSIGSSLALGMHNAVTCTEDAPFFDLAGVSEADLRKTYMGAMQVETLEAMCDVWPAGPIDDDFKQPLTTTLPTLLLSGSADPITPPSYADLAAVHLKQAWLRTNVHQGHGQIAVGCMPRVVERFLDQERIESGDFDCLDSAFVMPFFLNFAGPNP